MLILKPWYSPGANAQFKQLMEINTNFQGRNLPASALATHTFPRLNQCSISRGRETITWNAQRLHLLGCRAEECTTKQHRAEPLLEIIFIIRVPLHWVEKSLVRSETEVIRRLHTGCDVLAPGVNGEEGWTHLVGMRRTITFTTSLAPSYEDC